ncbi:MAG: alpha-amylase family glycosyl hydrolase [Trueperaceae bacterium]
MDHNQRETVIRYLHVTKEAQRLYALPPARTGLFGHVLELDHGAAAQWAAAVQRTAGPGPLAPAAFTAGELMAAWALHELMHALVGAWREPGGPGADGAGAFHWSGAAPGGRFEPEALRRVASDFARSYAAAADAAVDVAADFGTNELSGAALLEELLLLELARANPAMGRLAPLFSAPELFATAEYTKTVQALHAELARPAPGAELLRLLRAPQSLAPDSLSRQVELALELWGPHLRARYQGALAALQRAADVLREEEKPPPGPPPAPRSAPPPPILDHEPEAYSPDAPWMPSVVLVAKSTHVWLAQLSQRYGTPVSTLDAVPEAALEELAQRGFNALWLIGVWWRSDASRTVKRLRGQPDALASAYSVKEYVVAPELGGEEALQRLSERAARHGIRLASDMVPNHTAIDSTWLAEHPDWFVQAEEPPYPGYTFTGPDLSSDPRMAIRLEDHYYDGTDAAVVFQHQDKGSGRVRYVYHGNDGTALPWNDTAQLDFLNPDVRRAVIDTTVAVARRFSLIRLDAAMTLARRHVRRLWHPQPGEGGAIPSRSAAALSQREFEERMPTEFWRELVDALSERAPGTMLLAEAFWLMEVYFVRSLGMNRVYNSAFMHMTMNEQNADYRAYLKRYLALAPPVLERFVNYMSNPDEESAAEQYGDGDKAFGVTTLMATLPGLPMFGHGQVEGLREKYGMEFARPRVDEAPRTWHIERHLRQIAPLLRRRQLFAGSSLFRLFDLEREDGTAAENVYAYVNGLGRQRVLVAYNNAPSGVAGFMRLSAPFMAESGEALQQTLLQALGLEAGDRERQVVFTEPSGAETRVSLAELAIHGLRLELGAYEAKVFVTVEARERPKPASAAATGTAVRAGRSGRRPVALLAGQRGVAARRRRARRRR